MANVLKMTVIQSILSLHAQGWSHRRIARALGDQPADGEPIRPAADADGSKCTTRRLSRAGSMRIQSAPRRRSARHQRQNPQHATPASSSRRRPPVVVPVGGSLFWPSGAGSLPRGFIKTCAASPVRRRSATTACGGSSSDWEHHGRCRFGGWNVSREREAQIDFGAGARITTPDGKPARPTCCGWYCRIAQGL